MKRILVVDDEPQLLRAMQINLRAEGYAVSVAANGTDALHLAASNPPDVLVLDLGLPDIEGADVIRGIRAWSDLPIVVLSARQGSADKVEALDAGADDYVTKPFGLDELLARLRAVERRSAHTPAGVAVIQTGNLLIDLGAATVTRNGKRVHLTPREWDVLQLLVTNRGKLITQRQLLQTVWGPAYQEETQYLRVYMAQLRRKLETDPAHPKHLITAAGQGYRFDETPT
ncbi:two component transcriptional regulator, winged helix family [Pseudarthrobacter chlorophenolicus A6]|uniref:Transcriptional regulatory protein KdpE n=1 Tax=Pseudarthrobacter chlorophenolicus (strain ATCC 700700 / DSM 12829 / CIP 107037 / JCM 12360 / KCTC 9906 / NCIMB 13794 / A6) TaxID=452863 RepID=B8H6X1_PSECP|nr:response regulator [Pseudarthrobacter chlorophenolicus]ACL39692.1 two component transcriptional regulator, winged helix family [Pseudarthrobacter chlorophenolicus A6]SDQ95251.1 two-component system, OmpR family, KDP operon response regulator KdpE [Pseudarthrobacter chlorophenolicus]